MKKLHSHLLVFICSLLSLSAFGQKGTVTGTVTDATSGEPIMFGTVLVQETGSGSDTDLDGTYTLSLTPGTYTLEFSYLGFTTQTITEVAVTADNVTVIDALLAEESEMIEEVVITAKQARNTEVALTTIKRKSTNLLDGISSARFKKIGDSNAADAVKRVTGVSVEGGKYVYVRGLGDRYTKTMLNSVDIPGLDPDRNSLQIDMFPTTLLNNMVVYKTALAELPADFTGGLVNIETKDFPEEKMLDISVGMSYNPSMHFNDEALVAPGGSTDWLGFDDGSRALPQDARREVIPSPISGDNDQVVGSFLGAFNRNLAAQQQSMLPDLSVGMTYGDQFAVGSDNTLGVILSGSYKSSRDFYSDVFYGDYQRPIGSDEYELISNTTVDGAQGEENVLLGGMAGLAFKTQRTKHKLTVMHLQNGESKAGRFDIFNNSDAIGSSGYEAISDNLEYSEKSLTNVLLNGRYALADGDWTIDWRLSPTISKMTDPDIRKTAYSYFGGDNLRFIAGAGGNPSRIWRYLDEINAVAKVDIARKYTFNGQDAKLKFGLSQVYKERDYNILSYDLQFFGSQPTWTGDASEVLVEENIYPAGNIYYVSGNNTPNPNQYNSTVNNLAAYVSNDFTIYKDLKATVGLRMEKFVQRHTGRDVQYANFGTGNNLDNDKVLDAVDFFPSVNLIQALAEKQNLRLSYSRTIARPSFKELSFAQIIDPITNRIFNGGLFTYGDWDGQLGETRINNMDIRWEMFLERGQMLSASLFFKTFDDPIEIVRIPSAQTSNEFQPRNVGDGTIYGVEIDIKKSLEFIAPSLSQLSFSGNVTIAKSSIEMTDLEYDSRNSFAKDGEVLGNTREMAGQAPYIFNAGLTYTSNDKPLDMGLYYNVKGATLTVVGGGLFPDVYAVPFHGLNFSANYSMGEDRRVKASIKINNLLSSSRESVFQAFQAADQLYSSLSPGMSIGLGISYKIF